MSRVIEAKAVISGEDRTGKMFDSIAKKFRDVGKGAKVAAEVGQLGKQIDAFRKAQGSFAQARTHFRGSQAEVARLAKELDGARKAASAFDGIRTFSKNGVLAKEMRDARDLVKDLDRQFATAQRTVRAASARYEEHAGAVKAARRELEKERIETARLHQERKRLAASDTMLAGMGGAGRVQDGRLAADAVRRAQSRYLVEGMGAPARIAAARVSEEAAARHAAELHRRATASGAMVEGMGAHGAREIERIESGRRVAEGMGLSGRAAVAERERARRSEAEARRVRRAERGEAAGAIGAGAAVMGGYRAKGVAKSAIEDAADFDIAYRKQEVFTDIAPADQAALLKQAKKIGAETQFSNIDVIKAQTAAMQGLPSHFTPDVKAAVAEGIVGNVRNYSTLMDTDLKEGAEIIRSYLLATGKDISTKEKALFEANKATNQIVKMAKLGGMDGDSTKQYVKYAAAASTVGNISPEAMMALGSLASSGGLRGDEAGVAMRSMASKIVAPTDKGLAALNAAGIKYADFVHMPDQLSTSALEGQYQNKLGKGFTPAIRKRLDAINASKDLIADRGRYVQAVVEATGGVLGKTKKGTVRASDSAKAAKAVGDFHKMSAQTVDAEGLLDAAFKSKMTLPQLNAWLTDKHGGKASITQRQWEEYHARRDRLGRAADDPDWAKTGADKIMAGLGGAVENFKGSLENLTLAIGQANAGLIKYGADKLGSAADTVSQMPEGAVQALSLGGGAAALLGSAWGTLKLTRLALGLGGGKAAATAAGAAGAATAGTATSAGAAATGAGAGAAAVAGGLATGTILGGGALLGEYLNYAMPKAMGSDENFGDSIKGLADLHRRLEAGAAAAKALGYGTPNGGVSMPGGAGASDGFSSSWRQSRGGWGISDFLNGPEQVTRTLPLPPSMSRGDLHRVDPSGQLHSLNNTLDKAATASSTAANGGVPVSSSAVPGNQNVHVDVSGTATIGLSPLDVRIHVDADWIKAQISAAPKAAPLALPLGGSTRAGAASMPGAAQPPGAARD